MTSKPQIRNPGDLVVASNLANFILDASTPGADLQHKRSAATVARQIWAGVQRLSARRRQSIEGLVRSYVHRAKDHRAKLAPTGSKLKTRIKSGRKPGQKLTPKAHAHAEKTIQRWLYTPPVLRETPTLALVANQLGISTSAAYRIASQLR